MSSFGGQNVLPLTKQPQPPATWGCGRPLLDHNRRQQWLGCMLTTAGKMKQNQRGKSFPNHRWIRQYRMVFQFKYFGFVLSSCVFFRGSLPQSEAAARSMWSKPRNTSAQKFQQKTKEIVQVAILTCVTWLWSVLFFSDFLVWLPVWHFSFGALTLDHFFCGVRVCLVCYF